MTGNPNCTSWNPTGTANRDERCGELLTVAQTGVQSGQAAAIFNVKLVLDVFANPFVERFDLIPSVQLVVVKFLGDYFDPFVVAFNERARLQKHF